MTKWSFLICIILSSILSVQTGLAQDAMQWNLPDGVIARLGKGKINEIQYSTDGKILAVATKIGIWLYDTTTYHEIGLLTDHKSSVTNITFNPNGNTLASAGKDNSIFLWDLNTGSQTKMFGYSGRLSENKLRFSNDGKTLSSGGRDSIIMWDATTGEYKKTITQLPGHIADFSFSPLGRIVVSVTWVGEVCISDSATGEKMKLYDVEMKDSVFSMGFSPDGKNVAIGSRDGIIYLVDLFSGELNRKLIGHHQDIQRVVFSPDGNTLASSCYVDETVCIWNPHTGEHIRTIEQHTGELWGLAYSPDGNTLATTGSGDGTIRFWDAATGKQKHRITGHTDYVSSMVLHPKHNYLVCGYDDGSIRYWDIKKKQPIKTFDIDKNAISELILTSDGRRIIAGGYLGLLIYDVIAGKQVFHLKEHKGYVHSIALSPDGKTIVSGGKDKIIRLWDISTGELKNTLIGHNDRVNTVFFSPNGQTLISESDDNTIQLWNVFTGENIKTFNSHTDASDGHKGTPLSFEDVRSLAMSPDGKSFACGCGDMNIHLWDLETGKTKMSFRGHPYPVFTLTFSPNGKLLASASSDGDIRLWDTQIGEFKEALFGHTARVSSLVFSPDGKTLYSSSNDGTVLIWKIKP